MSLSEDCELQELVKQTLEKSGSMSKIRVSIVHLPWQIFFIHYKILFKFQAELRASVFLALEDSGCFQVIILTSETLQPSPFHVINILRNTYRI